MAAEITASTEKSAQTAVGDVATDEGRAGRKGVAAGTDEATRRPRGSLPLRMSPRRMPWRRLPRTRLPGGRGSGGPPSRRRPRDGRGGTPPPWMRPRGRRCGIPFNEATAKRGSVGRRFRRSHRMAAVVIASAETSVRTAAGDVVADEAVGSRGSGSGICRRGCGRGASLLWTRPRPYKRGERGPAVMIHRDSYGRLSLEGVSLGCRCK